MVSFKSISFYSRFLTAPLLSIILTMVTYFTGYVVVNEHIMLFKQLNDENLPQISETSKFIALLTKNNTNVSRVVILSSKYNKENNYIKSMEVLNELDEIERQFNDIFNEKIIITASKPDTFKAIRGEFSKYKKSSVNAVKLSSINPHLANIELLDAYDNLNSLEDLFVSLSGHHVKNLKSFSVKIKGILDNRDIVTAVAIILILFMLLLASYFSRNMSIGLSQLHNTLIKLSLGDVDYPVPSRSESYLKPLLDATQHFKNILLDNKIHKKILENIVSDVKDSELRYINMLALIPTGIIIIDHHHNIVLFNEAAEQLFLFTSEELIGEPLNTIIPSNYQNRHDVDIEHFELSESASKTIMNRKPILVEDKQGNKLYVEINISKLELANEVLMVAAITDVTLRKEQEDKIWHQANFDALTGLPNRFLSFERFSELLEEAHNHNFLVAILFIDLHGVKKVNDTLGYKVGNKLLIESARRLNKITCEHDTAGRLGGNEFIILLGALASPDDIDPIVENLLTSFEQPFIIDEHKLLLTASIGISIFPDNGVGVDELLKNADTAMYKSKEMGKNNYCYFSDVIDK